MLLDKSSEVPGLLSYGMLPVLILLVVLNRLYSMLKKKVLKTIIITIASYHSYANRGASS